MAVAYTKEFLVNAYLSRYTKVVGVRLPALRTLAENHYDQVGKDKFRVSASLDADALKKFRLDFNGKL
jgi:hypothetical protein